MKTDIVDMRRHADQAHSIGIDDFEDWAQDAANYMYSSSSEISELRAKVDNLEKVKIERPMSEAPRDGSIIIARIDEPNEDLYILVQIHTDKLDTENKWYQVGRDDLFNYDSDFSGWYPFQFPQRGLK